jgi:hypothetical protein
MIATLCHMKELTTKAAGFREVMSAAMAQVPRYLGDMSAAMAQVPRYLGDMSAAMAQVPRYLGDMSAASTQVARYLGMALPLGVGGRAGDGSQP